MTVDQRALRQGLSTWARQVHTTALDTVVMNLRPYAPRKTGELQGSIRRDSVVGGNGSSTFKGRVTAPVIQARTTDQGSPPHPIFPKRAGGVLVFEVGGQTVFARKVNHPGNRAKPWWRRGLEATWGPAVRHAALSRSLR